MSSGVREVGVCGCDIRHTKSPAMAFSGRLQLPGQRQDRQTPKARPVWRPRRARSGSGRMLYCAGDIALGVDRQLDLGAAAHGATVPQAVGTLGQALDVLVAIGLDTPLDRHRSRIVRRVGGIDARRRGAGRIDARAGGAAAADRGWRCRTAARRGVVTCAPPAPSVCDGTAGVDADGGLTGGVVAEPPPTLGGVTVPPPTDGAVTVWAPAVPAAATRARVKQRTLHVCLPPLLYWAVIQRTAGSRRCTAEFGAAPFLSQRASVAPTSKGKRAVYDYIIVGGGSAGSVLANRLVGAAAPTRCWSAKPARTRRPARSRRRSSIPIPARPISIRAPLDRAPGPHPDRQPQQSAGKTARRCASTSRRACWGGGSSINGQMANRGAPTDYAEWQARGAEGWNWDQVFPYSRRSNAISTSMGHGTARTAISRAGRIPVEHLEQARAGGRRGLQARGLSLPARPERRVRRRLFPGYPLQTQRAACFGRHRLPEPRDAQTAQPHHLDRHAGEVADL